MRELYVLCIEIYSSLTRLPHPTHSLGKLNTLIIDSCEELETISVVGELVNLRILILRNCKSIEKLPSEMKRLYRLKLLELTWCTKLQSIGRGIISSLVGLEELKILDSFNGWEAEDREERENAGLRELENLTNLTCLEIDILDSSLVTENMPLLSKKIVTFLIRTDRYYNLPSRFSNAMVLSLESGTRLGDWIEMQLLRDTDYLDMRGDGAGNVLDSRGDGANNVDLVKSENIRWLELGDCESMKNVVRTSRVGDDATVFPSLEFLNLDRLPELQEICDGPISSNSFQNLSSLKLNCLWALTHFWKSSSVCENINNVPHFSNLSSIDIRNCGILRNLGQLSMAGKDCLPQLEDLTIGNCEMMEQVFLWNNEEVITTAFPKLKEVWLFFLPNLTAFYQGIQGIEFPLLSKMKFEKCPKLNGIMQPQKVSFRSLKELEINRYGGSFLFTPSMAANLVSLEELRIEDSDEMIKVIDDEQHQERILLFPKLERLYLQYLPKLVSFCDWKCEVELPLLKKIAIVGCQDMEYFTLGLVGTPKLQSFSTDLTSYVGVGVDVAFNSLKELHIFYSKIPWYDDKISVSLFNGLETLIFSGCKGSMSLFSSLVVGNLVSLKVLYITQCDEIVKVIEDNEEEKEDGKVVSGRSVVFPKLEELRLEYLPLVRFSKWKCDVEFPSLTKVEIRWCDNMESFSIGFVAAPNLKILQINDEEIGATKDLNGLLQQRYYLALQEEEINEEEEISNEVKDEIEVDDGQN